MGSARPVSPASEMTPERVDGVSRRLPTKLGSGAARAAVPGSISPDSAGAVRAAGWGTGEAKLYGSKTPDEAGAKVVKPTVVASAPVSATPAAPVVTSTPGSDSPAPTSGSAAGTSSATGSASSGRPSG
ncbi:MAG: hypothetical protein SYR96_39970, partial [Actinomycetota bacterium]|nr:hypothetical protein [Actinomycetota bacterium]